MPALTVNISPLAFEQINENWLGDLKPYAYQSQVYRLAQEALTGKKTLCLFLVTPTGSGKTLGSYAYAINEKVPAFGVYPTNELIRDQENALKPLIDPTDDYRLLRIDSQQLDYWQDTLDKVQHATTFETLMNWKPTILTNPDILFYTFFGLYAGSKGIGSRLFALMGQYQQFVFDEFHLYNVKQMADVAYLVGTLHAINPHYGRVFTFASATPESPAREWLERQLQLPVEIVEAEPSISPQARTIAHSLQLTLLPADLRRWQSVETLLAYLPELGKFFADYPQARLVTILDSVAGAITLAQTLREQFPGKTVSEIHGFSSSQEREQAVKKQFTVGTSTIEVGIDFKDETGKDLLIYEARTAAQFIQRFGRLARHEKILSIPNRAIALVPEYVYHFLTERLLSDQHLSRKELYSLVEEAYQKPTDFAHYIRKHAPAEFTEARRKVQSMFQPDERPRVEDELGKTIEALTGKSSSQAWGAYRGYEEKGILQPLLTFRGSGFEAAILDERATDPGLPAKRYNLMFLLRRGIFTELEEQEYLAYLDKLANHWPEDVAREKRYGKLIGKNPKELLGVYGFFVLTNLLEKTRKVWFEVSEEQVYGRKACVTVISDLQVSTDPGLRLRLLNRHLGRKQIVAWFVDQHPATIQFGRALPPLFELHELRVRRPGGALSDQIWSIAFNQDAFFVDSLGWWKEQRNDQAIIL